MDIIDKFLSDLSGGDREVGSQLGRLRVSTAFGYLDARFMVFMKETHGLPLSMSALYAKNKGLKVNYDGLKWELEKIGKNPKTIEAEIKEIEVFSDGK